MNKETPQPGNDEFFPMDDEKINLIRKEAMEYAGIGIYIYNFDGVLLYTDRSNLKICELDDIFPDPRDAIGRKISDYITYTGPQGLLREKLRKTGFVNNFEYAFKTIKGNEKWILHDSFIIKHPLTGEDVIQAIIRDITELKKIETAYRQIDEKYRLIVENANEAITIVQKGRNLFFNDKMLSITGYDREEFAEISFFDIVHPEDRDTVIDYHYRRLDGKDVPRIYEIKIIDKSKKTKWINVSAVQIEWESEPASLGLLYDITEQKKAEMKNEMLQLQLSQSRKMEAIGTLAGGIAHDFNNLLTAIIGTVDLVMLDLDNTNSIRDNMEIVQHAAKRASDLTRQLLLFSRKQPMKAAPVNINKIIENLMKLLERIIGENIEIRTDLTRAVRTITADEGNIEQLIMNLSVNARDAMPDGGRLDIKTENISVDEKLCASMPDAYPGNFVLLSISDTGIGIDHETIEKIFDPFFSTKGTLSGTGLGLSVVYGIVKQHSGWIEAVSEPGSGTQFKIYLPAGDESGMDASIKAVSASELRGSGEKILLVEDQEEVLKFAVKALTSNNYNIYPAASAGEAIEIFDKENGIFDLIFSDVVLPDINGLQLVEMLAGKNPRLKILLSSGYTDNKSQWDMINKKGYPFLNKPYTLHYLLEMIHGVISK